MSAHKIRILVASPTEKGANHMSRVLSGFAEFDVVGIATDLAQVFRHIDADKPDFILLSQKFRGSRDSEVLMSLLREEDIRWLELASRDPRARRETPATPPAYGLFEIDAATSAPALAQQIRAVCRNLRAPHLLTDAAAARAPARHPLRTKTVLIGASTGGVDCLLQLLEGYNAACPPTLIVQHTGNEFIASLINLLDRRCPVPVFAAGAERPVSQGQVAVAGDGLAHLELMSGHPVQCRSVAAGPISGHRPSVDALFRSAVPRARDIVAVLLTGMGRDGAEGMLALRRGGATTIAQDKASSVVYGMPRVAHEIGGAQHVMGISGIAAVLNGSAELPDRPRGA